MDQDTVLKLKTLGVYEPVCEKCLSEDFKNYKVLNGQVLSCDNCDPHLRDTLCEPQSIGSSSYLQSSP